MKKLVIIIVIFLIVVLGYILFLRLEIPENPELKISIEYNFEPKKIYYFYPKTVIETNNTNFFVVGIVPYCEYTKYYFDNEIDLTLLVNYINTLQQDEYGKITITDNNGNTVVVTDNSSANESNEKNQHTQLLEAIRGITSNAKNKQSGVAIKQED